MKKLLNILLIFTSLIGYLEWPNDHHGFLFQLINELLFGPARSFKNFLHPAILLPLIGYLLLIYTLFQKLPSRILSFTGLACISVIMIILLIIGILNLNFRIMLSTIPFMIIGVLVLRYNWKRKKI